MAHYTNSQVLRNAREDFELFYADPVAYRRKVDEISNLFGLDGNRRLRNDYLPGYVVGNLEDGQYKYALFGINPGFSEKISPIEERWKDKTWERHLDFIKNFFTLYYGYGFKSRYYNILGKLLGALENVDISSISRLSLFFQTHLINLDLIPYHSPTTGLPDPLDGKQLNYLQRRLDDGMALLKTQNIRLALFTGKPMHSLLIKQGIVSSPERFPINDKVSLYAFEFEGIRCILFDRFLSQPAFGITNDDLTSIIPDIIRKINWK